MATERNSSTAETELLANYDPDELIVAVRLRELTRQDSPFLDFLKMYKPERLIALLKLAAALQGEDREKLLALFEKNSGEGLAAFMKFYVTLGCDPEIMPELLEIFATYPPDEIVRMMEA